MFSHTVAIDGGKAKVTWQARKLKSITVEFDEPVKVDPMMRVFDLRSGFAKYLQGLDLVHEKTEEFLKSADTIKDMNISQVPKEIRHIFVQKPGPMSDEDTEIFRKFKKNMAVQFKDQILAIKEKTIVSGEKLRIKKIVRKSECECETLCYILKKKDGTHWWKCEECGKEVRAKKTDITESTVVFMLEKVSK